MNDLMNLQNKFQSYLMTSDCDINIDIEETKKVSASTRLQIYSNAYRFRLIEALASNFLILQKYLGDDQFEELAILYIATHPSTFKSILWFGGVGQGEWADTKTIKDDVKIDFTVVAVKK